ncbi:MAG: succinate dehydrogenase [Deltaproteobacteria bacterium]|nr:MAG: succinate dehydrogenase [Deltaproteobacteria bacterium]
MNWFFKTFTASIGKKLVMAATGLIFCLFLFTHLIGNLMVYRGGDKLVAYSEHLHSLGLLINIAEWGLIIFALFHIYFATLLFFENWRARPVGYVVNKRAGGRTWSSDTMPYTGLYLLAFVIIHLINFHFADRSHQTIYQIVAQTFSHPGYVIFYVFSMIVAAFHVRHGLWSAFQTLGLNHPKYMPFIRKGSVVFGVIIGVGFGSIPIFLLAFA